MRNLFALGFRAFKMKVGQNLDDNLYRLMPKGSLLPVPLTTGVRFGNPIRLLPGETKPAFLERARQSVITLASTPPA